MTKKKKLAKNALKHPELFSQGELVFFQRWLEERKLLKRKARGVYLGDGESVNRTET